MHHLIGFRSPTRARLLALALGLCAARGAIAEAPDAQRPERIYHQYCSVCHGERGDGLSMARYALDPPPADFTSPETRRRLSRSHMLETLRKGARSAQGAPTAMVAWTTQLDPAQIEAVVDYVIVRFMEGRPAPEEAVDPADHRHAHHDHSGAGVAAPDIPYGLSGDAERGKPLYRRNCAGCHGAEGDGRGGAPLPAGVQPRNFSSPDFKAFATGYSLYSAIARGNPHMPAWEQRLGRQQIADVAAYVLDRFVGREPAGEHGEHRH